MGGASTHITLSATVSLQVLGAGSLHIGSRRRFARAHWSHNPLPTPPHTPTHLLQTISNLANAYAHLGRVPQLLMRDLVREALPMLQQFKPQVL